MNKEYKYFNCELGETQYADYDFNDSKVVEARYVEALVESDKGNPFTLSS